MNEENLSCDYDSRNSFYGKAIVITKGNKLILRSYSTEVAEIDEDKRTVKIFGTYSQTTLRHIKEFLKQNGFKADNKKQIEEDYLGV